VGSVLTALTIFGEQLKLPAFDIGFMWPSTVGLVVTFGVGYVLSWILPRPNDGHDNMTFRGVMRAASESKSP
jgi:hypothetical protein